jgi:hypothetical protein
MSIATAIECIQGFHKYLNQYLKIALYCGTIFAMASYVSTAAGDEERIIDAGAEW